MENKSKRIKYNHEFLSSFCDENNLILLNDYSKTFITGQTKIEIKCIQKECNNVCIKKFRYLVRHKNFGCIKCSTEIKINKCKSTCINKYGCISTFQTLEVKNKIKETMLNKYGVESPLQSEELKNKFKNTCLQKFGVENPFNSEEIKNKAKSTCLQNFGVENPFESEEIKNKIKQYNIAKYGTECNSKSEELKNKYKQTCLSKYGCESHLQNDDIKQKIKNTNIIKYGVENVMHNEEIMDKSSKNAYKVKEYKFKSGNIIKIQGYEDLALNYLIDVEQLDENDIITGSKNVPKIWYNDNDGKKRRHYVDIFIPSQNKCIEVKSTWTFKKKEDYVILKQDAAKKMGYNYELWIYDGKGNRIDVIV